MLTVIRSQSGRRWESRRLLQHLRSPAASPPHPPAPRLGPHLRGAGTHSHSPRCPPRCSDTHSPVSLLVPVPALSNGGGMGVCPAKGWKSGQGGKAIGASCKGWWGWGGGQRGMEMFWGKSQGVLGAEHGFFPDTGPLPHRIRPPPRPLQSSLLRDLTMHPRSPGRWGVRFPPLPHSLMALCNWLIPASQVRLPGPTARPLMCSPGDPMPALCTGPPSAHPVHPQPQPGVLLHVGLSLSFPGETTGEQGSQRHLGSPMPLTPP